jgi:large subunit ribosomal protein L18
MHTRTEQLKKRQIRIRSKLTGTQERPRIAVTRSNQKLSVQLVDDIAGKTLTTVSSDGKNKEAATVLGTAVAKWAKDHKISRMIFDRSGYLYHGSIAALAQAIREGGIEV